jgi:hypothetical protein
VSFPTNPLKRLNREPKFQTGVVGIFLNEGQSPTRRYAPRTERRMGNSALSLHDAGNAALSVLRKDLVPLITARESVSLADSQAQTRRIGFVDRGPMRKTRRTESARPVGEHSRAFEMWHP